jgi:hypothetical protein
VRKLIINKKTGFKNLQPHIPVIIRDERFTIFYSTEGLNEVRFFNLPKGEYYIDSGSIEQLKEPVKFKRYPLPAFERKNPDPSNFKIVFGNNPNKCTIQWRFKRIFFDNSFKSETKPKVFFILYHEFGHSKYETEKYADLFAANMMLDKGYNPSQIGKAPLTGLSSKQFNRKKFIVNSVRKWKQKH